MAGCSKFLVTSISLQFSVASVYTFLQPTFGFTVDICSKLSINICIGKRQKLLEFLLVGIFFMPDYFDSLGLAMSLYSILLLGIFLIGYWAAFEEVPVLKKTTV